MVTTHGHRTNTWSRNADYNNRYRGGHLTQTVGAIEDKVTTRACGTLTCKWVTWGSLPFPYGGIPLPDVTSTRSVNGYTLRTRIYRDDEGGRVSGGGVNGYVEVCWFLLRMFRFWDAVVLLDGCDELGEGFLGVCWTFYTHQGTKQGMRMERW